MKKDAKIKKEGYMGLAMGLVLVLPFLPVLLVVALIMGIYYMVSTLIKHLLFGIQGLSSKVSACSRSEIPRLFHRLMKEEFVENAVSVSYSYVMSCGCQEPINKLRLSEMRDAAIKEHPADALRVKMAINECFPFFEKRLTIHECEALLNNFNKHYSTLDKANLATITLHFDVKFKRFKDIDDGHIPDALIKFCKNKAQENRIARLFKSHSSRYLGRCRISYGFIGEETLCHERSNMVTFPAQAKYATSREDSTFRINYDGYECGYRAMLEGAQDNIN